MKNKTIFILILFFITIVGCKDSGFHFDPTKLYPEFEIGDYWIDKFDQRGLHNVEIYDDKLFCDTSNGYKGQDFLYCFNLQTGKVVWKVKIKNSAAQKIIPDNTGIGFYFVGIMGEILRIDSNGKLIWEAKLVGSYRGHTINPLNNNLIVNTVSDGFYEYDDANGETINHFVDNHYTSTPKFVDNKILFTARGRLQENTNYILNYVNSISTESIWQIPFPENTSIDNILILKGRIYLTSSNKNENIISCYELETGEGIWQQTYIKKVIGELNSPIRLGTCENRLFAIIKGKNVFIDTNSGEIAKYETNCLASHKNYTIHKNEYEYEIEVVSNLDNSSNNYTIGIRKK